TLNIGIDEAKVISNEMTLANSTANTSEIEDLIYELANIIQIRLKKECKVAKTFSISLKYERKINRDDHFNKKERMKRDSHQYTLTEPTDSLENIYSVLTNLFYEM